MIVTLLTDFGTSDEYVGVLKGVMLGINPRMTIVDLSHHIPPQDITAAGYMLRAACNFFPAGTIHLVIVDPGVGTDRHILAARLNRYVFMAPDNGILPLVWGNQVPETIVRVENQALFRQPVSSTFHGRDIFASVAAHISKGIDLADVGRPVELTQVKVPDIKSVGLNLSGELVGEVVTVDRFGNLITNIEVAQVEQLAKGDPGAILEINIGDCRIEGLAKTYIDGAPQKPLALVGSRNCIEVALGGGSAAELLNVGRDAKVCIKVQK